MKLDAEALYAVYLKTKSVHRTAVGFGTTGETVRKHLIAANKRLRRTHWKDHEIEHLKAWYTAPQGFDLVLIAACLERSLAAIACKANELGLTRPRGEQIRTTAMRAAYRIRESKRRN